MVLRVSESGLYGCSEPGSENCGILFDVMVSGHFLISEYRKAFMVIKESIIKSICLFTYHDLRSQIHVDRDYVKYRN